MPSPNADETCRLCRVVALHVIVGLCYFNKNFGGIVTTYSGINEVASRLRAKFDR